MTDLRRRLLAVFGISVNAAALYLALLTVAVGGAVSEVGIGASLGGVARAAEASGHD